MDQDLIIDQALADPSNALPYQLKDIFNCTFEPDSSLSNDSDEIPVKCSHNFESIFNAYNVSFEDYVVFARSGKVQIAANYLNIISFMAMTFDEVLSDEYERVVHQIQGTEIE
jgi:hypothetical protein